MHLYLFDFIGLRVRSTCFKVSVLGEPYGPDESDSSLLSREGGPPPPIGPNSSRRGGLAADADDVTPEGEENIAG